MYQHTSLEDAMWLGSVPVLWGLCAHLHLWCIFLPLRFVWLTGGAPLLQAVKVIEVIHLQPEYQTSWHLEPSRRHARIRNCILCPQLNLKWHMQMQYHLNIWVSHIFIAVWSFLVITVHVWCKGLLNMNMAYNVPSVLLLSVDLTRNKQYFFQLPSFMLKFLTCEDLL